MCSRGKTFILADKQEHLHFVVTDPVNERVLIIGITSNSVGEEFVLNIGDHNFINRKSYIYYAKARVISVDSIRRHLQKKSKGKKRWKALGDASCETMKKICEGILKSKFTSKRIKKFYRDFLMNSNFEV